MANLYPLVREESGECVVIASGLVFTFSQGSNIDLILQLDDQSELTFRFSFENDETGKQTVKATNNEQELRVKCINFNNPLGSGLKQALEIGKYKDKTIYLTFLVYSTEAQKKLEYCFFIDK